MDWSLKLLFTAFLLAAAAIHEVQADAMVIGTVFCDQCKDGQRSLFDYPIYEIALEQWMCFHYGSRSGKGQEYVLICSCKKIMLGIKVKVSCADSNEQTTMSREETTNMLGSYVMRFDGTPNLSNCYAQVSGSEQGSSDCGVATGPAQNLRLMLRMFDMEMYAVDSLLTQPAQPMSFCPKSANPVSPPVTPSTPPAPITPSPARITPPPRSPPPFRLPPMPRLPPLPPMPPTPFVEATACPHQNWTMPEYKCYWRVLNQDSKVAFVFGPIAGRRYGTDMTLRQGLLGRGDPYRTLLREGTTALLNSYNSLQFSYNTLSVITNMNLALMGSPRSVLLTALRFMRANSGSGNVTCKFTPCK